MRLSHISLTARNADALAAFYRGVFGLIDRRPPKRLSGAAVARGNGLPGAEIYALWLALPDDPGPFLEILEYDPPASRPGPGVNDPGFGHLAFAVPDLRATLETARRLGGSLQGQITNFGTPEAPNWIVYIRDPEGNILELDQPAGR